MTIMNKLNTSLGQKSITIVSLVTILAFVIGMASLQHSIVAAFISTLLVLGINLIYITLIKVFSLEVRLGILFIAALIHTAFTVFFMYELKAAFTDAHLRGHAASVVASLDMQKEKKDSAIYQFFKKVADGKSTNSFSIWNELNDGLNTGTNQIYHKQALQ